MQNEQNPHKDHNGNQYISKNYVNISTFNNMEPH